MTNLDSMFKSREITLQTKVHPVKDTVIPVIMYGCASWMVKKAEHWRIDAFELWCWRRLLRVPWTARRSNQSILKRSALGVHWKTDVEAKTQILWPPHVKSWLIRKDRNAGKYWGGRRRDDRGWDGWMASPTRWTSVWVDSGSWWWTGKPGVLRLMGPQIRTRLSDWTELFLEDGSQKMLQFISKNILPMFCSRSWIVSGVIFRSLIHLKLIYVYGVKGFLISFFACSCPFSPRTTYWRDILFSIVYSCLLEAAWHNLVNRITLVLCSGITVWSNHGNNNSSLPLFLAKRYLWEVTTVAVLEPEKLSFIKSYIIM